MECHLSKLNALGENQFEGDKEFKCGYSIRYLTKHYVSSFTNSNFTNRYIRKSQQSRDLNIHMWTLSARCI